MNINGYKTTFQNVLFLKLHMERSILVNQVINDQKNYRTDCYTSFFVKVYIPGPNLDLLCVQHSDAALFCGNYTKLYFDAKHLEKGSNRGW